MNTQLAKTNGFALKPTNMQEAMQMAEMLAQSNMVPKSYKNQPGDTLVAMMMGSELGLNPIQALQNLAVINGKPSIYGDALLALVQNHPSFGGIEETFDDATKTAICTVWRKGATKHSQKFSQQDAQAAGLWGKTGPWTQYPKRMLAMRARGFALRNQFADALLGLITAEEAQDLPLEEKDITPAASVERVVPQTLGEYPQDQFDSNFVAWEKLIQTGRKTSDEIIATVSTKYQLTDDQTDKIQSVSEQEPA